MGGDMENTVITIETEALKRHAWEMYCILKRLSVQIRHPRTDLEKAIVEKVNVIEQGQ